MTGPSALLPPRIHEIRVAYARQPEAAFNLSAYEWGDSGNAEVVFCVHGLTRNARDFDYLATVLAPRFRVIAVDMPGRGRSEWLKYPEEYGVSDYLTHLQAVFAHFGIKRCRWVGTSMGGIIGMVLASAVPGFVQSLVLNDVGTIIPRSALLRLGDYVGKRVRFPSREAAEQAMREIYAPFGLRGQEWDHFLAYGMEPDPARPGTGAMRLAYDPQIGQQFADAGAIQDIDLWEVFEQVQCPVLLLRGVSSDLLLLATAEEMRARHRALTLHNIPGAGHAPALAASDQTEIIRKWLLEN